MSSQVVEEFQKQGVDPDSRLRALFRRWRRSTSNSFTDSISQLRSQFSVTDIVALIDGNNLHELIQEFSRAAARVAAVTGEAYVDSARSTASLVGRRAGTTLDFDLSNPRVSSQLRSARSRMVTGFTAGQSELIRTLLLRGVRTGMDTVDIAREIQQNLGLTVRQEASVNTFRTLLESNSREALQRQLRDRRFDPSVLRAIRTDEPLSQVQIDRMVQRYRERFIRFRADTIGGHEALRAIHQANNEMYQQAVDLGDVQDSQLERTWITSGDELVRSSHAIMNGQIRIGIRTPFISGMGNMLVHPGDPNAPLEDIIVCRCMVRTRLMINT